jgi:hypothetical protein
MPALILTPNLTRHDDIYERLVQMHDGLSEEQSLKLWAKLCLVLINHIGDQSAVIQAIGSVKAPV